MQFQDLTAQRVGSLTVLERSENGIRPNGATYVRWLCACDCGARKVINVGDLKNGNTTSCGRRSVHRDYPDEVGRRYGRLVVLSCEPTPKGGRWWKCICDCGVLTVKRGGDLRAGHTASCGCLKKQRIDEWVDRRRLPPLEAKARRSASIAKWRKANRLYLLDILKNSDRYMRLLLSDRTGVPLSDWPAELVEMKREQMFLRRLAREIKQAIKKGKP